MDLKTTFLATGSNQGDRLVNLQKAVALIATKIGTIAQASQVYVTQAWGLQEQPDFLNQVLEVKTPLSPEAVLAQIQQIETQMGRQRQIKWGERIIDIDILFYEQEIIQTEQLTIPHPFLQKRNFVLIPLAEIAPDWIHPVLKQPISYLQKHSIDKLSVKIWSE